MKRMSIILLIFVLGAASLTAVYFLRPASIGVFSGRAETGSGAVNSAEPDKGVESIASRGGSIESSGESVESSGENVESSGESGEKSQESVEIVDSSGESEEGIPLRIMTYNIRHGRGSDGKVDLERTAGVIRDSGAEIVGLNEVDRRKARSGFQDQVKYLAEELQMYYAFGPTINRGISSYGNALLSKYPFSRVQNHLLPGIEGLERRGLLEAGLTTTGGETITVMTTHLSLDREEREGQVKWLRGYLEQQEAPFLLMGDFNNYNKAEFPYQPLNRGLNTFPSTGPTEEIDLFFSALDYQLSRVYTIESAASDHLPVVIELLPS